MIERLVSGGQTGVDRAALDASMELGIPCGGWCPKGRKAEDGVIPAKYPLVEKASAAYRVRTARNVEDSDATLILARGRPRGGTRLTVKYAEAQRKPVLVVDLSEDADVSAVEAWLAGVRPRVLNVAGPRESQAPGICAEARESLLSVLRASQGGGGRIEMTEYRHGDRVRLVPIHDPEFGDVPAEYGVFLVEAKDDLFVVLVDEQYRGEGDNGIRLVPEEQMERLTGCLNRETCWRR